MAPGASACGAALGRLRGSQVQARWRSPKVTGGLPSESPGAGGAPRVVCGRCSGAHAAHAAHAARGRPGRAAARGPTGRRGRVSPRPDAELALTSPGRFTSTDAEAEVSAGSQVSCSPRWNAARQPRASPRVLIRKKKSPQVIAQSHTTVLDGLAVERLKLCLR